MEGDFADCNGEGEFSPLPGPSDRAKRPSSPPPFRPFRISLSGVGPTHRMDGCIPGSLSTDPPSTSLNSQTGSVAAASIHGKGAVLVVPSSNRHLCRSSTPSHLCAVFSLPFIP